MRFLMGTLFGLVLSLVVSRVMAWRKAPAADEGDCASQLAEAEARRDALRARFQRKLQEPDAEPDAPAAAPAAATAATLTTQDEPSPTRRRPGPVTDDSSGTPGTKPRPSKPNDLTRIEGIGPKIAGLLKADGIETFGDLAKPDTPRLSALLEKAGSRYRLADPSTWAEQAALAAADKWDALETLQDGLKGGRRV